MALDHCISNNQTVYNKVNNKKQLEKSLIVKRNRQGRQNYTTEVINTLHELTQNSNNLHGSVPRVTVVVGAGNKQLYMCKYYIFIFDVDRNSFVECSCQSVNYTVY